MDFDGQSVARSLRDGGDGVPIEWPEEIRRPHPMRWVMLAGFAIVGATTILIASGVGNAPASVASVDLGSGLPIISAHDAGTPPPSSGRSVTYAVTVDGVPTLGRADAKVTVVAVTEYGCTDCEQARHVLTGLRDRYGDDVRVAYKPYATPESTPSLLAACAAARNGSFQAFDEAIWRVGVVRARQLSLPLALPDTAAVAVVAQEAGFSLAGHADDLTSCDFVVRTSRRELEALRVTPPAYFVNGKLLEGAQATDALQSAIDEELARATHRIEAGTARDRYYQEWVIDLGRTTR